MNLTTEPAPAPHNGGVFAGYRPPLDVCDEMKDGNGVVRSHWAPFIERVEALGRDGLTERREGAQQLLHEHGVTYNVYAEGRSAQRMWNLDMLPLLLSAREWARIETGLIQRTRLLNLVLADIYGPQRLLGNRLIPPALLHANPGFLRPCHGVHPPHDRFLSLHAVDLTRAPSGEWWVLADRTQAPSGVGYALENRIILSRVLADEFRNLNVQRLASFFVAHKNGLAAMTPWTDSPNIVLLTPGPFTETYFEHAYLARYLGYPLVEGSDLTVRDRRVFIKTIEGLQPVDVIIRRVNDTYCDPVALRNDSFLGVPGLVEAARAGNVAISNALGAGAVEASALLAFLPALARELLGEELIIPNVATWWCGQHRERDYTLSRLRSLVVKRAFVGGPIDPVFGETLDGPGLVQLAARIQATPHGFVGQERVALSTAPVWNGDRLEPRPLILRCYTCTTRDGYAVMSGGLTRVSASPASPIVTSKRGGGSKDTWVVSENPVEEVTLLDTTGRPAHLHRSTAPVPSRVVDNLFWLGRYAERLENDARLLRTALSRLASEGGPVEEAELAAATRCLAALEKLPSSLAVPYSRSDLATALRDVVFAPDRVDSVRGRLSHVAFLTASLRDRFSGDTWRILNQLQSEFPARPANASPGAMLRVLHRLVFHLAAFSGMEMENMTRGHAWHFLEIGRRLERAGNVAATIRAVLEANPADPAALSPLLEYSDSTMTYRRRYFTHPELPMVVDLLLGDASNPRSFAFQVQVLGEILAKLPGTDADQPERREFAALTALLDDADLIGLGIAACAGKVRELDQLLERLIDRSAAVSDLLTAHYFTHVPARAS